MSPEWVLHNGRPFARALVLSHTDQLAQLTDSAPEAVPSAVIAGDPCFDRIRASLPFRARYRDALRIGDRTLIYVSSTWSQSSAFGVRFDLLRALLAELPRDSYAVAIALHPNISHRHGPGQLRHWFADCLRAGLIVLSEIDDWRTGLIAADIVIGDNGSATGYGAAIGRPTLLAAFPDVPEGTSIALLGRTAARLPAHGPYRPHIDAAITDHTEGRFADVAALVTTEPGRALTRLQALFYRVLDLAPPPIEVPSPILPTPANPVPLTSVADQITATVDSRLRTIRLIRRPAEARRSALDRDPSDFSGHLCCSIDYPMRSLRERADVLVCQPADAAGDPVSWLREVLRQNPFCMIIAISQASSCTVLTRAGDLLTLTAPGAPIEALASAVLAWIDEGLTTAMLVPSVSLELGGLRYELAAVVS